MKLQLTEAGGRNVFTGYGEGYVAINDRRYERSVVVMPNDTVSAWDVPTFDALTAEHFEALAALSPEILILGTGTTLRFPRPELTRAVTRARIGLEVMDTRAACRTYNILVAENRKVVAAIVV